MVTGTGTAKDPRTSTRFHLRLLEKNVLEHMYRGDVGGELTLPIHDDLRFRAFAAFGRSGRTGSFGFFTA